MISTTLHLAWRNTFRHHTRTAIALLAITFGLVALVLAGGFVQWIFWATREASIQNGLGHIQVVRPGYRDSGTADPRGYLLPETSPALSSIESAPQVKAVVPRLNFGGLVSLGDVTLSFVAEGVDAEKENGAGWFTKIVQGESLSAADSKGILLGMGLADNLGAKVGDTIVLLVSSASGGINAVEGHVRGVFATEAKAFDDVAVRLPIGLAREVLKVSGSNTWVVVLNRTEQTNDVLGQLRTNLASAKLEFLPWFDLSDFYVKTVALLSSQMNFVRLLIGLIIVLSISNMLIMNVLERTGEIGTLMAMGSTRRDVMKLFLTEGLLLGVLGGTIGLLVGLALAWIISEVGIPMPPPPGRSAGYSAQIRLTLGTVAGAVSVAVGTTALAAVFPAWKASRLVIVDALRHNH